MATAAPTTTPAPAAAPEAVAPKPVVYSGATVKFALIDKEDKLLATETVPVELAFMSNTLKQLVEDMPGLDEYPVKMSPKPFEVVMQWLKHHAENPEPPVPETDKYRSDNIPAWDQEFFKKLAESNPKNPLDDQFTLILDTNYLDIPALLAVLLKTTANLMKGKSAEEIKKLFEIPPTSRFYNAESQAQA
jgi:S-phase kinase-associated protein 1